MHWRQRYFSRGNRQSAVQIQGTRVKETSGRFYRRSDAEVAVYRTATDDLVQLSQEIRTDSGQVEIYVECNAAELREIAARLLDAAHDLDVNPSSKLALGAA